VFPVRYEQTLYINRKAIAVIRRQMFPVRYEHPLYIKHKVIPVTDRGGPQMCFL
jgi:hypothetical protein